MIKIKINGLNLSCDASAIPAQGSANVPISIEVENKDYYSGYAVVPYVGWFENGVLISTVRELENNYFTIPPNAFKYSGIVKIAFAYIKDTTKIKTLPINFDVVNAPETETKLPNEEKWETLVSNLVSNLFDSRFENEINTILENVKKLNSDTTDLQTRINSAISRMGNHEWNGAQIRFQRGDGSWGPYHDLSGNFATKADVIELKNAFNSVTSLTKQLFLLMHPVGCIYMSTSSVSPQTTFGGTWVRWGNGRVPVGVDSSESSFNTVEKTGGEKQHTLTISEIPNHVHGQVVTSTSSSGAGIRTDYNADGSSAPYPQGVNTQGAGGNQSHNNLQPYITCYMWKRTA